MFCTNCGKKLPEGAKFCNYCGTPQSDDFVNVSQPTSQQPIRQSAQQPYVQQPYTAQSYIPPQPTVEPKQKKMSKACIIMLACGILSVFGGFSNGSFARMAAYGMDLANLVTVLIQFGLIVGGIVLIFKTKGN